MTDALPTWVGRTLNGRYKIDAMLGHGGMSTVFQAIDPNLKRTVAVKMIHAHLSSNPQFVKRFEQEAAAVASLRHPNIVQVFDFNHHKGIYYMVMENVPGETLEQRLTVLHGAGRKMSLTNALSIMVALCDAVAYAHDQGMVHRDLKPSNVIIDTHGRAILMDFGVAKIVGGNVQTETGATIGTAAYMSPEQVMGKPVDHRADIYSLGVILYELTAGKTPFQGETPLTVMMAHVNDPPPDIRLTNNEVPDLVIAVLEKALAKEPEDRFQSAVEMGATLRTLLPPGISASQPLRTARPVVTGSVDTVPKGRTSAEPMRDKVEAPAVSWAKPASADDEEAPPAVSQAPPEPTPAGPAPTRRRWPLVAAGGAAVLLLLIIIALAAIFVLPDLFQSLPPSTEMIQVPAGTYSIGSDNGGRNYAAAREVDLDPFWIDRFEVTNAAYAEFVVATDGALPAGWDAPAAPAGLEQHAVQGVTWDAAAQYCQWQNKRLPKETEWEVAARGPDGLLYPWGEDETTVSLPQGGTYPVGSIPANRSPFGLFDMAGNVWEWVDEPYEAPSSGERVLRGGAHDFLKDMAYRLVGDPTVPTTIATAGFRCAADEVEIVDDSALLIQEQFIDPQSGWPEVEEGSALSGYHPPDYYHVQSGEANHISTAFFGGSFENVDIETTVFVDSTDTDGGDFRYGLIVRRVGDQYYAFTISPRSGRWSVLKATPEGLETLEEGAADFLNGAAGSDTLRVDVVGDRFAFAVDGRVVAQLTDSDYSLGDVGFFVQTFDETRAHIHYDDLTVRSLASVGPTNVLLADDFADPASGWPEVQEGSALSGYHPPDYYHVQSGEANHRTTAYFDQSLVDFTMTADIFVDSTDTTDGDFYYGLIARREGDNYYAFWVSPRSGRWQVFRNGEDGSTELAAGEIETLVGLSGSGSDALRIDLDGSVMIFQINGIAVAQVEDASYAAGQIGFIVETLDETRAHVHYDALLVTQVEMDMAAAPTAVAADPAGSSSTATPASTALPPATATAVAGETPAVDPEAPSAAQMVFIPAGQYTVGDGIAVDLADFWIDRYEVTNAEYALFLAETDGEAPAYWSAANIPTERDDHPVEERTWAQAAAYCEWAGKRLPGEAEWEIAARGPKQFLYPWGDEPQAVRLTNSGTYAVGHVPANRTVFGAFDMAGNVWEWVDHPYLTIDDGQRVLRGGANNFQNDLVFRAVGDPESNTMFANAGIRCAADQAAPADPDNLILGDDFADLDSGWWQARAPIGPYFYGYHPTDFYHVQVDAPEDCLAVNRDLILDDFMAELSIFVVVTSTESGDFRYGLMIRESNSDFYAFAISPRTQRWYLLKNTGDGLAVMDEGDSSLIIAGSPAARDRLFVIANGPELTFFINGELVSRVVDGDYISGSVGFFVETFDETYVHTHYDSIRIWELPADLDPGEAAGPADYPIDSPLCSGAVAADNLLLSFITHSVVAGETLSGIALEYGVTIEDILGANGRTIDSPSFIREGQMIVIPQ